MSCGSAEVDPQAMNASVTPLGVRMSWPEQLPMEREAPTALGSFCCRLCAIPAMDCLGTASLSSPTLPTRRGWLSPGPEPELGHSCRGQGWQPLPR
jgi:hypothetical protein